MSGAADVTLVVMTRNRRTDLEPTLGRLTQLSGRPPVIVADNGSSDGTPDMVASRFPDVRLLRFEGNVGVAARNAAARTADTPYVAFNDDDSWWTADSLDRLARLFDDHPTLGALTAHVVVEPGGRDDPTSLEMRDSPVEGDPRVPGIPVLGFLACALAVRRDAFLDVGGFEERLHFAGEEELLATDLARAGWQVRFDPQLRIHHQASTSRDHGWRQRRAVRNGLWTLWLRRPAGTALERSWRLLRDATPPAALGGLADAVLGGAWVVREREVVPAWLEEQLRRLHAAPAPSAHPSAS